tara:strand:+ start:116 stop:556 length:441 start_codon:yes stop_codon:yes gene_type:complete
LSFIKLKKRIKSNEGFSLKPYKDQLGFYTIGYGHLIRKNEHKYFKKKFTKNYFDRLFEDDFEKSKIQFQKKFCKKKYAQKDKELLIEMIFQLGPKGVSKFKKMIFYLNNKQKYMACLEMMDSLWYTQTPKRVINLIDNFIGNYNGR